MNAAPSALVMEYLTTTVSPPFPLVSLQVLVLVVAQTTLWTAVSGAVVVEAEAEPDSPETSAVCAEVAAVEP